MSFDFGSVVSKPLAVSAAESAEVALDSKAEGPESVTVTFSIGDGRGSGKVSIRGDQFDELADAMACFDPNTDLSSLTPAEVFRRTARLSEDGTAVEFKCSLAKHARTITVPLDQWNAPEAGGIRQNIPALFAYYANQGVSNILEKRADLRRKLEAEEAAKAARAAKRAEHKAGAPTIGDKAK